MLGRVIKQTTNRPNKKRGKGDTHSNPTSHKLVSCLVCIITAQKKVHSQNDFLNQNGRCRAIRRCYSRHKKMIQKIFFQRCFKYGVLDFFFNWTRKIYLTDAKDVLTEEDFNILLFYQHTILTKYFFAQEDWQKSCS